MISITEDEAGPFARAAETYRRQGWAGTLPLPAGRKHPPPAGWTGRGAPDPSYPDITAWAEDFPAGNIALRLPDGVIGLDVDDYDGKPGAGTLAVWEQACGVLPPTWRTSARPGLSGIRYFRVPAGLRWPGELQGGGVEIIQHIHRYAVVPPSVHPSGTAYRWYTPEGAVSASPLPPAPGDLAELPVAWLVRLTGGELDTGQPKTRLGADEVSEWLAGLPWARDEPCPYLEEVLAGQVAGSRHEAYRGMVLRAVSAGHQGHHGALTVLDRLCDAFLAVVAGDRTEAAALGEFRRLVLGAVALAAAEGDALSDCDCWGQQDRALREWVEAMAPLTLEGPQEGTGADPAATVRSRYDRLTPGWSWLQEASRRTPPVWGVDDYALMTEGEALVIAAGQGAGKSTLAQQLALGRLGAPGYETLLGHPVTEGSRKVLYLAMDRPRQIARSLGRMVGPEMAGLLEDRLVVWPGPPLVDLARHDGELLALAQAAGADLVVVDSIKDAAVGLSDDEVGAGWNRARQRCLQEGVEMVELHHLRKANNGDRSRRPSIDDLYGSTWITSGAGSVLYLSGDPGSPAVTVHHLKQPMNEVGPLEVMHDQDTGRSVVIEERTVESILSARPGLTATEVAQVLYETDDPSQSQRAATRRRLGKAQDRGLVEVVSEGDPDHGVAPQWGPRTPNTPPESEAFQYPGYPSSGLGGVRGSDRGLTRDDEKVFGGVRGPGTPPEQTGGVFRPPVGGVRGRGAARVCDVCGLGMPFAGDEDRTHPSCEEDG